MKIWQFQVFPLMRIFDRKCVYVGLYNSTHSILIISRINRSHYKNKRKFTDKKRDGIPCFIIFPWFPC